MLKDDKGIAYYFDQKGKKFYLCAEGMVLDQCQLNQTNDFRKQVYTATAYIKFACKRLKTANKYNSSYTFKHQAEKWGDSMNDFIGDKIFSNYVSNAAFILAAVEESVSIFPIGDSYNCWFNLSSI